MSDIRLVKLKSGEEIIGDVTVIDKMVFSKTSLLHLNYYSNFKFGQNTIFH